MSNRQAVLRALRDAQGAVVSGESLALRLGISRSAVAKHIKALKDLGYEISAVTGSGYSMATAPDLPLPSEVAALLGEPMWVRLEGGASTGSTNDDARKLALEGCPSGTAVLAARQRKGRGRFGRTWESPEGGVYLSAVLRPQIALADLAPIALVISVGVARGLRRLGADAKLKWPNDLVIGSRKLSGVLVEVSAEVDQVEWVVAGVGVNVRPISGRVEGAAYLEDVIGEQEQLRLPVVAAAVLDGMASAYAHFERDGFEALRAEYESLSTLAGKEVVVRDVAGIVCSSGRAFGIDGLGRLLVEDSSGEKMALSAGDVTLKSAR